MDNVLNFVYDDWDEVNDTPHPNRLNDLTYIKNYVENNWLLSSDNLKNSFNVNCKNWKLSDVPKFPNKIFYYHIWNRDLYNQFFKNNILPVNQTVIDAIKNNNNLCLILMNECETESGDALLSFDKIVKSLGIDPRKVWFIHNGVKLNEQKYKLNVSIKVHSTKYLITTILGHFPPVQYKKNKKNINNFFLCHNRMPRIHRLCLLCLLENNKLLNNINWSLICGYTFTHDNKPGFLNIFNIKDVFDLLSEIKYFSELETKKSNYEIKSIELDDRKNQRFPWITHTYENSYVNIVTETMFDEDDIHITEKSFKPFYYYQFPLILASHEHIKYMKNVYGFDFFEDVIDYSYDSIKNNRDRLFAFVDEIKRINQNKEFFIEFYKNNEDRFIKNHNIVKNFKNTDDLNFFKSIMNKEIANGKKLI